MPSKKDIHRIVKLRDDCAELLPRIKDEAIAERDPLKAHQALLLNHTVRRLTKRIEKHNG